MQPYLKPLPVKAPENMPFWDGLDRGEFRVPKCNDCGDWNWIPYPACRSCLSDNLTWTPVSGKATLFSFTIVYRGLGAFNAEVPYVIALAELPEKPRSIVVQGNLVGIDPEQVKIGMPLKIVYETIECEDVTLWRFMPDDAA